MVFSNLILRFPCQGNLGEPREETASVQLGCRQGRYLEARAEEFL